MEDLQHTCQCNSQQEKRRGCGMTKRMATRAQAKRIYAIWWTLGESYYKKGKEAQALREFLKRRFNVKNEMCMDHETAQRVIAEIIEMRNRKGGSEGA